MREPWAKCLSHLRTLRDKGLVSQRFGRLRSKRLEKAYAIYFKKRLPISTIGQKVGLKNFQSLIQKHRRLGWNVPPSLYVYDRGEKRRILSEIQRRKQW
jgi:predicted transcriptional regulator